MSIIYWRAVIQPVYRLEKTLAHFLLLEQQFVHPAGSFQQQQEHARDWTPGIGLEGGTGSATVWNWAGSSLLFPCSSGK